MTLQRKGYLFGLLAMIIMGIPSLAQAEEVLVSKGTEIPLKFASSVRSKTSKVGQKVYFTVSQDVVLGSILIVKKGTRTTGTIRAIKRPGKFGKSARVHIDLDAVEAVDGTPIPLQNITRTHKQGETTATAGAASIGGALILGPVGVVSGLFVKGREVEAKPGRALNVEVVRDTRVNG
ncbi:MAG: hypothetical protein IT210_00485 [Armatimonadetes bacterium]|nr:hypothetical protein [Armatimonadota bacterium]